MSFNIMAAVTICSDFEAQEKKICHFFHFFPFYLLWSDGTKCHDLSFFECWVLSQLLVGPFQNHSYFINFSPFPGNIVYVYFLSYEKSLNCVQLYGPHGLQPARLLCPWNSPGKNTVVGSCSLLQGIFPTQGLNLGLPHCRWILYCLSQQEA